ncbi:hypothetical protein [Streptomyces yunnanensis]|uniref:hypothetical protein n=1 Tax=Streptomyces yunnanensis TaxID=156453 RepID=UPI0009369FCD|nr:hypothetical protein [Streptomyces yunnanensis]
MAIELPSDLIDKEHSAWTEIQAGALTVETALEVHEAIMMFAAESGERRLAVEMELKRVVRHPEPEGDA